MVRRFPDALTFLFLCLAVATALTWVIPAGEYQRREDPVTHRAVVVANTFPPVPSSPVPPFAALVAIPRGFTDAAGVIGFVLLVGAGIAVVARTGALAEGVDHLIAIVGSRQQLVVPIVGALFAVGGVTEGMMEEIIPLVPVLLIVARRLGYRPVIAVAMGFAVATVGGAFSPMNPFQVGIAQRLAGVPVLSGWGLRVTFLIPAVLLTMWWTVRSGRAQRLDEDGVEEPVALARLSPRSIGVLLLTGAAVAAYVIGVLRFGWDFEQMAAVFLLLGIGAGLVGGLGVGGTTAALADGFRGMVVAAIMIALARAIYVVLQDGHIIDAVVHGLFVPVSYLPRVGAAIGMMVAQAVLHVPVSSTTGQAVLSLPILVPLSDLLRIHPQVTVLAYQYGAGLCEMLTPTNGAMMAVLAAAGVAYEDWLRFVAPLWVMLMLLGAVAIAVGMFVPAAL